MKLIIPSVALTCDADVEDQRDIHVRIKIKSAGIDYVTRIGLCWLSFYC